MIILEKHSIVYYAVQKGHILITGMNSIKNRIKVEGGLCVLNNLSMESSMIIYNGQWPCINYYHEITPSNLI